MRRVVKVGGSLLSRKELPAQLRDWFEQQRPAENIVIVGGGELIDAIRNLDSLRPGDASDVHWRCVDLLRTTFEVFCDWFPDWDHVRSDEEFQRGVDFGFSSGKPTIVEVGAFYQRGDDSGLPLDWRTTTDSIAAVLGIRSKADEVVLLKSCDLDPDLCVSEMIADGITDEALGIVADKLAKLRVEKLPLLAQRVAK